MELENDTQQRVLGPLKNDKAGVVQKELLQSKGQGKISSRRLNGKRAFGGVQKIREKNDSM